MNLYSQIEADIKAAMLAKDKVRLQALRGIKKLSDDAAMKILVKMAKQRRESAQIYQEQNRADLAETELAELAVIEAYLPKPLTEEELTEALKKIIAETGATSAAQMGKVMGVASKALAGRADGRAISAKVRELLS